MKKERNGKWRPFLLPHQLKYELMANKDNLLHIRVRRALKVKFMRHTLSRFANFSQKLALNDPRKFLTQVIRLKKYYTSFGASDSGDQ